LEELQQGISLEVIADRHLPGDASQALRRLIANGEDLLNHQGMRRRRWGLASTRVALQDLLQRDPCGQFFPQAFEPFFSPTLGAMQGRSQLGMRPVGMLVAQIRHIRSRGIV
jgi:hypothetical protein